MAHEEHMESLCLVQAVTERLLGLELLAILVLAIQAIQVVAVLLGPLAAESYWGYCQPCSEGQIVLGIRIGDSRVQDVYFNPLSYHRSFYLCD